MEYKVFGCKTNKYFTDKWAESPFLTGKKWVFVSSCVVTDKAKAKWARFVRQKLRTLQSWEKIYISGCGSIRNGEIDENFYTIYPEFLAHKDLIVLLGEDPSDEKLPPSPPQWGGWSQTGGSQEITTSDLKSRIEQAKQRSASGLHTKKFIVVQTGCDNFCTFCLTVQARGRHRSRSAEDIIQEIQAFALSGWQEAVITGTNLGAWGAESSNDFRESKFVDLVKRILEETTIPRLRISSLGVEFMDEKMTALFSEPRINPYVHLSIQSGSDRILKSMNRHYDRAKLISVLEQIRSIQRDDGILVNIGADLIVGFPGETEADFQDTLDIVRKYGITQLHAFPFSPHKDHYSVPAGSFHDQIPDREKERRLQELISAWEEAKAEFLQKNVGQKMHVLVERLDGKKFQGWSENYIQLNERNFQVADFGKIERGEIYEGILQKSIWLSL